MRSENREVVCAELRKNVARIHKECFGRGPSDVCILIFNDILFVKIKDFLSTIEKQMLTLDNGKEEIVRLRNEIFNNSSLETLVSHIVQNDVVFISPVLDFKNEECYLIIKFSREIA